MFYLRLMLTAIGKVSLHANVKRCCLYVDRSFVFSKLDIKLIKICTCFAISYISRLAHASMSSRRCVFESLTVRSRLRVADHQLSSLRLDFSMCVQLSEAFEIN